MSRGNGRPAYPVANRISSRLSLDDTSGLLDDIRDVQPFCGSPECPLCQMEDQLDWDENQEPCSQRSWLRTLFWGLALGTLITFTLAWWCLPHSIGWMCFVGGCLLTFVAGHVDGRLGAAQEMEE